MSAPLAKSDFVFKLASSQSYIRADYDSLPAQAGVAAQAAGTGRPALLRLVGDGLAGAMHGIRTWLNKQATLTEMGAMSDRELADIGLVRADVPRVFDADFVADHARGRIIR